MKHSLLLFLALTPLFASAICPTQPTTGTRYQMTEFCFEAEQPPTGQGCAAGAYDYSTHLFTSSYVDPDKLASTPPSPGSGMEAKRGNCGLFL